LSHSLKDLPSPSLPPGLRFGTAEVTHIESLREMGAGLYLDSRYYFDGNFVESKIDEFYRSWIEKGVRGQFDDCCYCLFDESMPLAFCTTKFMDNGIAKIGVFGVAKDAQSKGYGRLLLLQALAAFRQKGVKSVSVVTQGRNYPAQRLYQSVGFRTVGNELWYHKWIKQ
jgi:ribosomal protein S18 acetylase RimI-like enzyme